jgi:hypothetical protein
MVDSTRVMQHIRQQPPDITMYLRDIYYSGTVEEVDSYFLGDEVVHHSPQLTLVAGKSITRLVQ